MRTFVLFLMVFECCAQSKWERVRLFNVHSGLSACFFDEVFRPDRPQNFTYKYDVHFPSICVIAFRISLIMINTVVDCPRVIKKLATLHVTFEIKSTNKTNDFHFLWIGRLGSFKGNRSFIHAFIHSFVRSYANYWRGCITKQCQNENGNDTENENDVKSGVLAMKNDKQQRQLIKPIYLDCINQLN